MPRGTTRLSTCCSTNCGHEDHLVLSPQCQRISAGVLDQDTVVYRRKSLCVKMRKRMFASGTTTSLSVDFISTVALVQCLVLVLALRINVVLADCWHDKEVYDEGVEVATAEPCLNCTCTRGVLLCYLRVCQQLPNPPPSGCLLLHRHRTCCPQLICIDPPMGNRIEARSDSDYYLDFPRMRTRTKTRLPPLKYACISNGSIYAPGSAMDTSTQCQYCYCLGGEQKCVQPTCLPPMEGCIPTYDPNDCCPIQYNCTYSLYLTSSTSTTEEIPTEYESRGGCIVERKFYTEGNKILGFGHSICDNCYCIRGMVRCEPLSCAPALFGCLPVIKPGECCPASYNCSGTIETHPEPNYGQFPVVSKEYAKLRKETQYKRTTSKFVSNFRRNSATENTNSPFYVIAVPQKSTKSHKDFANTESSRIINIDTFTTNPYYVRVNQKSTDLKTQSNNDVGILEITYRPKYNNTKHVYQFSASDHDRNKSSTVNKKDSVPTLSVDLFIDGRINRGFENDNNSLTSNLTTTENDLTDSTTFILSTSTEKVPFSTTITTETNEDTTTMLTTTEVVDSTMKNNLSIILKTVLNSTECVEDGNATMDTSDSSTVIDETSTVVVETTTVVEMRNAANLNKSQISATNQNMEMLLINNLTKAKEDYDFDYAEPTLPPSLPNLRIIPFVAADALETKRVIKKPDVYAEKSSEAQLEEFPFSGMFSPPAETEGGFIPKETTIINDYYPTTNEEATNQMPAITTAPKTKENGCIVDGRTVTHEESITTEGSCKVCVCYFGSLVCHEPECPPLKPGCRTAAEKATLDKSLSEWDSSKCCPKIICDETMSTLPTPDVTIAQQDVVTVAEGIITPLYPLSDVIKAEPAPDLHLLINDRRPYFAQKQQTTTVRPLAEDTTKITLDQENKKTTTVATATVTSESTDEGFSLDKVWKLLFSSDITEDTTTQKTSTTEVKHKKEHVSSIGKKGNNKSSASTVFDSDVLLPLEQLDFQSRDNIYDNLLRRQDNFVLEETTKVSSNMGLLKLAGCNIYGRMYRVGRIISELSGPCLECKCTETGVQCQALKC